MGPPPPVGPGGTELGGAAGEGVPLITPGKGDGGPAGGIAVELGDGWGVGAGGGDLIVYVVHTGVELEDVSMPHTLYEPGTSPLGGAVGGVVLVQLAPEVEGTGLVAQLVVFPKDQDTWS